jgi:hypothetical protein
VTGWSPVCWLACTLMSEHRWITRPDVPDGWFLVDAAGNGLRLVKKHLYLGQAEAYYRVTGGDGFSDHPSLEEAIAAAETSLA